MIMLDLENESATIAVRPSGTEPKVKFYMATTQVSRPGRAVEIDRCRSCVKVAIPQRRGR